MTRLLLALAMLLAAGCSTLPIDTTYSSRNQVSRVQFLVIQFT